MQGEEWADLEPQGFPGYGVSNWGRVINENTGRVMALSKNQQGFHKVGLMTAPSQRITVQVNHLVAVAFLPIPDAPAFDSVIHLNGNKEHAFVDNLTWRPRWFSLKYHAQFRDRAPFVPEPIVEEIHEEVYDDSRDAAKKHGLLEKDIFLSTCNRIKVFPTWQIFRILTE